MAFGTSNIRAGEVLNLMGVSAIRLPADAVVEFIMADGFRHETKRLTEGEVTVWPVLERGKSLTPTAKKA